MSTDCYLKKRRARIEPRINRLIKIIAGLCSRLKIKAYLVGGPVRDLLLGEANIDLDIALDKDVERFSRALAKLFCARVVYYRRFKTATLFLENLNIDIATTREEVYPSYAVLPLVKDAPLERDLFRRDFTINAIAIGIKKTGLGSIIDPFNGMADLKERKIRILHKQSFLDDPTRIIRALRFEKRFNFSLEKKTLSLLKEAVSRRMLYKVTPSRLANEMLKLLQENRPLGCIKRLNQLCGLSFLHRRIKFKKDWNSSFPAISRYAFVFNSASSNKIRTWLVHFIALFEDLKRSELNSLCRSYALGRSERRIILHAHFLKETVSKSELFKQTVPSLIYRKLKPIYPEALIYLIAKLKSPAAKNRLLNFIIRFDKTRLELSGEDLKKIGFIPGPIFNKILERIYLSKLDSRLNSRREELKFAREIFRRSLSRDPEAARQ